METPRSAVRPVEARTGRAGGIGHPGGRTGRTGATEARRGTRLGTPAVVMAAWRVSTDGPVAGETSGAVAGPAWSGALSTESEARARVTFAAARQEGICMEESLGRVSRGVPGENVSWPRNHAPQRPSIHAPSVCVLHPSVCVLHPSVCVLHPSRRVALLAILSPWTHENSHSTGKCLLGNALCYGGARHKEMTPQPLARLRGRKQLVRSCHV